MQNDNIIICIGRQLGSGGHVVAKKIAEVFGCKLYDKEILNLAARESGFCEECFDKNDEKKGFLDLMFHVHVPFISDNAFYDNEMSQENLFRIQSDAIRKAAEEGPCVFVGRCAEYVLREHKNLVSIFITADIDERIAQIRQRHDCTEEEARKIIENQEKGRSSYYNYYTGKTWGKSESYDLCINSSRLGMDGTTELAVSFIRKALERKAAE